MQNLLISFQLHTVSFAKCMQLSPLSSNTPPCSGWWKLSFISSFDFFLLFAYCCLFLDLFAVFSINLTFSTFHHWSQVFFIIFSALSFSFEILLVFYDFCIHSLRKTWEVKHHCLPFLLCTLLIVGALCDNDIYRCTIGNSSGRRKDYEQIYGRKQALGSWLADFPKEGWRWGEDTLGDIFSLGKMAKTKQSWLTRLKKYY